MNDKGIRIINNNEKNESQDLKVQENYSDDIEDFSEPLSPEEDEVSKRCFAIYKAIQPKAEPIGTGLIISDDGSFLSVAHNFNDKNKCVKARFNGDDYDIELLAKEYDGLNDWAIGRLKDFKFPDDSQTSKIKFGKTDDLKLNNVLNACGFRSVRNYGNNCEDLDAEKIDNLLTLHKQRLSINSMDLDSEPYFKNLLEDDKIKLKENAIQYIEGEVSNGFHGFSGGPIYFENKVLGIIRSYFFIRIEFFIEKLKELKLYDS